MEDSIQVMTDQFAFLNSLSLLSNDENQAFSLLLTDGDELKVEQIVRRVPYKRLVCKGIWKEQAVYAKLFIGKYARRYAQRDVQGVKALIAANIATPKICLVDKLSNIEVLIFKAITQGQNVESIWAQSNASQRLALACALVQTLGHHHHASLMQTDLYLKNFLFDGQQLYTIDGDGIRQYDSISHQQASSNFAVLLSKFDVLDVMAWMPKLLTQYHTVNPSVELVVEKARHLSALHRTKVASAYANKKVFRTCTDVKVTALRGTFYAASRAYENIDLPVTIEQLDQLVTPQKTIKSGNTCTVATAQISDATIVIKRYNIKSVWHGLSRALRPSRAAISWANAHRLQLLGIATAKPVALLEARRFGLRGRAYILSEYIDAPDVAQYFAQTQNNTERAEAVKNIVTLFYKLYLLQISHGDMKSTNIKMQGSQPVLIDLDSMHQHAFINQAAHARDLQRFMRNWQNDNALYNAFVKTFKVVYPDDSMLIKAGIKTNKEIISQ